MSLIRKVFWPAALAIGFLVFLGAIGGFTASPDRAAYDTNVALLGDSSASLVSIDDASVLTEVNADAVSTVSTTLLDEKATVTAIPAMVNDAVDQNVLDHALVVVIGLTSIVAIALLSTTIVRTMCDLKSTPSTFGKSFALMLSGWTHLMAPSTILRLTSGLMLDTRGRDRTHGRFSVITRSLATAAGFAIIATGALMSTTGTALAGDAGLADSSGSSWALFVIVGVIAFTVAGLATLRYARR